MQRTVFDTELGPCEISWSERGVSGIRLLAKRGSLDGAGASPPGEIREAIALIRRHLSGRPQDLSGIRLDLSGLPPFFSRVYRVARKVRPGETISYGELAQRAGSAGAARAVGQAMARNRFLLVVPCHRVLARSRKLGGFSAPGGAKTKAKLLRLEGADV